VELGKFNLLDEVRPVVVRQRDQGFGHLWPRPALEAVDLWQVTEHTPLQLSRKLGGARFIEFFRGLLARCGLPQEALRGVAYNRLRRFLPTGGTTFSFDNSRLQALGSWTEAAQDNVRPSGPKRQRLMSHHYAGNKTATSCDAKRQVIDGVLQVFHRRQGALVQPNGLLGPSSVMWKDLSGQQPSLEDCVPKENAQPGSSSSSCSSSSSSTGSDSEAEIPDEDTSDWQIRLRLPFATVARTCLCIALSASLSAVFAQATFNDQELAAWAAGLNDNYLQRILAALNAERAVRQRVQNTTGSHSHASAGVPPPVQPYQVQRLAARDCFQPLCQVLQPSCIMSQTLRVDLQADDRGLHSCFAASGVKQDWIQAVVSHHRLETLDDFVYMINKGEWESSLAAFVQEVGVIRDNRLALARFKAAWQAGSAAIAASQQAATRHQQETDLEEPLPEATTQQLQHDFQKAYGFVVETHLEPSDALRGRVYREFRRHTMTVIEARKIKSVVAQATPQREESVSLQGGLTLNFHKDSVVTLRNAVDYFWSLRILAYAWAWAGNYISKDIDGKDKKMIDLTSALNYADLALRWCMEFGNGQLSWIQRNDVLTRGKLASR
ncbi:unnamed protein product, partial [Symbiodinium necroappetens]